MAAEHCMTAAGAAAPARPMLRPGPDTLRLLAVALVGVVLITGGVHHLLERGVTRAILAEAEADALRWSRTFNAEYPGLLSRLVRGMADPADLATIREAIRLGPVFRLNLFAPSGRIVFDSAAPGATPGGAAGISAVAARVFATGVPEVSLHDTRSRAGPGTPLFYAEAYVPAVNAGGFPIGVLEVYVDKSQAQAVHRQSTFWLTLALPALTALLYLAPALAFVAKSEQARRRAETVHRLALYDPLTGALNRGAFARAAAGLFAARLPEAVTAVVALDLDRFKTINDTRGHDFGDAFLAETGERIAKALAPGDIFGRLGGDEFVLVLPGVTGREARERAGALRATLCQPVGMAGRTAEVGVSMGLCLCPATMALDQALHQADLSLHHARATGRGRPVEYIEGLDAALERRRHVEHALKDAWQEARMQLHYQPLIRPADRVVVGFEALLRLTAAGGEPISPAEFIPVAEETGMIHDIGLRALRAAVLTARSWPGDTFLSVNLSPLQFLRDSLVADVATVLEELDFPGHRLELEVTETLLLEDEQRVARQIAGLRALGVSIAMDDFGTGYSSLGYLWKYSFDKLKVDGAFLEGYAFGRQSLRDVIATIVLLGRQMGMQVTVEGVETPQQLCMLQDLDCDQYQGFLFGRPMPASQTLAAIRAAGEPGDAASGPV